MKTIYIISTILALTLALDSFGTDKTPRNERSSVAVAPFIWGTPEAEAPAGLRTLKAKNAFVPIAPFVWGNIADVINIDERLTVPVAPFVYGNPDSEAPAGLEFIKAISADVPLAPFILGDPEAESPVVIDTMK